MKIGMSIKTIRKNRNETQIVFSEKIGITQAYLSQIENGQKKPSMELIENISLITDTPIPVLFWFGISESDVCDWKIDSFRLLKPIIDLLLNSIFTKN